MKRRVLLCFLGAAVLLGGHDPAVAADKPAGYAAYKLVWQRNIFDPQRRAPEPERASRSSAPAATAPRTPSFRLSGTMVSDDRMLAFFGGSSSDFNKVITTGEKIGDFTVKKIGAVQVELTRADQTYQLEIGQQLTIGDRIEIGTASSASASSSSGPPPPGGTASGGDSKGGASPPAGDAANASSSSPPSNDKTEVLRKMMERRRQEMNK
ncbi:MAG: hypothetical protein ABI680_15650 [Chthoniobacteraceae bacterium]